MPPPPAFQARLRDESVKTKTPGSASRHARAVRCLAGGVSSSLRRGARPWPLYFDHGDGAYLVDVDGNRYADYTLAWGPLILGHASPVIAQAISAQAAKGLTFGAQHDLEIAVAEKLVSLIPCADSVCFANSGTEIVQLALRLARAATGRQKYLKFEGHYHGWADTVLVSYHPSSQQLDEAQGRPIGIGAGQLPPLTPVIAEWNNPASVQRVFDENPGQISAIICEPLVCNSSCLPPAPGFLEFLRDITARQGALLIFDEVITGFRIAPGGAQQYYGVAPDLATYAKAVGAGTPLSVLAGSDRYMRLIAGGQVVHSGTLNGNPICLAAALAALDELNRDNGAVYAKLHSLGDQLRAGIESLLHAQGLPAVTNGVGPVFHVSFADSPPKTYRDTLLADQRLYSDLTVALLDEGVHVLPDGRWYLSTAHDVHVVESTLEAVRRALL